MNYRVTRKFIGGILKGMFFTETTSVPMEVGFKCFHPIAGSPYEIVSCVRNYSREKQYEMRRDKS